MHIGIVIWQLMEHKGGLQKAGVDLAHAMLHRGHQITIFYYSPKNKMTPCFPLQAGIKTERLVLPPYASSMTPAKKLLRDAQLDVLVALFSWSKLLWFPFLLQDSGIPWIISEHTHPEIINNEKWNAYERHACLYAADRIHLLQESFVPLLPQSVSDKIRVIPNAAPCESKPQAEYTRGNRKILLGAGRFLENTKQFSLLIRAFSSLASSFPDWDLVLCGSGRDETCYKKLIASSGTESRIFLAGMVEDMQKYYSQADIFCLPSRYEGFPLVLLEAQHHMLPVVGFSGCAGVNSYIVDNVNGLFADAMTPESLAMALSALMRDEALRKRLGAEGKQMLARYAHDTIYSQWEQMFEETSRLKNATRLQHLLKNKEDDPLYGSLQDILSRPLPFPHLHGLRIRILAKLQNLLNHFRTLRP